MGLLEWLTGRNRKEEKDLCANFDKVEEVVDSTRNINKIQVANAQDSIYEAFERLNMVNGLSDYVGKVDPTAFDQVFDNITSVITQIADQIEQKANDIKIYNDSPWWKKGLSTLSMGIFKQAEGLLMGLEGLGDGIASIAAWIAPKDSGFEKACKNFIDKNWSHDIFNFYYDSEFAKSSSYTEQSAICSAVKLVGGAASYLALGPIGVPTAASAVLREIKKDKEAKSPLALVNPDDPDSGSTLASEIYTPVDSEPEVSIPIEIVEDDPGETPLPDYPSPSKPSPSRPSPSNPSPSKPSPSKPTPSNPTPTDPTPSKPDPQPPSPNPLPTPDPTPGPNPSPGNPIITGNDILAEITDPTQDLQDPLDNIENNGNVSDSFNDLIGSNEYTKIPTSSDPIIASTVRPKKSVIPVLAGLSAAAVAGLGTKAYLDKKENNQEEEIEAEDWDEENSLGMDYEQGSNMDGDYLNATDEYAFSGDEDPIAVEYEAKENNVDLNNAEPDYLVPTDERAYEE